MAELRKDRKNAVAWLCLVSALAVHVLDEATTGFLPFYNNAVLTLRENLGFFPAPRFTFASWLTGLILVIVAGFLMLRPVACGGKFIRVFTTAFAAIMLVNSLGHIIGSAYLGRIVPGFWSSFLLLPCSLWMFKRGFGGDWSRGAAGAQPRF